MQKYISQIVHVLLVPVEEVKFNNRSSINHDNAYKRNYARFNERLNHQFFALTSCRVVTGRPAAVARAACSRARAPRRSGRPLQVPRTVDNRALLSMREPYRACSLAAPVVFRRWTALAEQG